MNLLKTFVAASAIALASFGANASMVTSGGITWNPDSTATLGTDFFASSRMEQFISADNVYSGFGIIDTINGSDEFCAYNSECSLTYVYSGFDMDNEGAGGTLDFYVNTGSALTYDASGFITVNNSADVIGGSLWLSLTNDTSYASTDAIGTKSLTSLLSVVDGVGVASNFDTNSMINGSDLIFASEKTTFGIGTGDFHGDSIPEPTTLAIFGLGLLGLAGAARRRKA